MPLVSEVGDSVETVKNATFEWRIRDFLSLSQEPDEAYLSPVFAFSDAFWRLFLYPNGQSRQNSVGWIDLYLAREDHGLPKTLDVRLAIMDSGMSEIGIQYRFSNGQCLVGEPKCLSRVELMERREDAMASNVLTVLCKLSCQDADVSRTSLMSRLREVCHNLRSILEEGQSADFVLTCRGRQWPVHRAVLGGRSEYFQTMFLNNWAGSEAGSLKFTEVDADALDIVLRFVYTGEVGGVSCGNVLALCDSAGIFGLPDLKAACFEYLKRNMGPEVVFGAMALAQASGEEELLETAIDYVIHASDRIFEAEEWTRFKGKYPVVAMRILEKMVVKEGEIFKEKIKLTAASHHQEPAASPQMALPVVAKITHVRSLRPK